MVANIQLAFSDDRLGECLSWFWRHLRLTLGLLGQRILKLCKLQHVTVLHVGVHARLRWNIQLLPNAGSSFL